jgi:hypothetical protein
MSLAPFPVSVYINTPKLAAAGSYETPVNIVTTLV